MKDAPPPAAGGRTSRKLFSVFAIGAVVAGGLAALIFYLSTGKHEPTRTGDASVLSTDAVPPDAGSNGRSRQASGETRDYSASNVVSLLVGQEGPDEGLAHLDRERDGPTTMETLDGVPCRYLNRKPERKGNGFLYFTIHPDFKRDELKAAQIEIEYFTSTPVLLRLQYDGMEGETPKRYRSVLAEGGEVADLGGRIRFTRVRGSNAWQTATFHATDGVFLNSQNGGADFRLEIMPPEIYVRRVTVTREAVKPSRPQSVP
jgi:hypothetical protein